jgi:hypothetical protein
MSVSKTTLSEIDEDARHRGKHHVACCHFTTRLQASAVPRLFVIAYLAAVWRAQTTPLVKAVCVVVAFSFSIIEAVSSAGLSIVCAHARANFDVRARIYKTHNFANTNIQVFTKLNPNPPPGAARGVAHTTVEQWILNVLYTPISIVGYTSLIKGLPLPAFATSALYILLFPINIWVLEIV